MSSQKPSSETQACLEPHWPTGLSSPGPAWQPDWPLAYLGAPDRSAQPALLWTPTHADSTSSSLPSCEEWGRGAPPQSCVGSTQTYQKHGAGASGNV